MAGKGSRHRFELSRLEIAGVILSAAAGLFLTFLFGLYAGRGMVERRLPGAEQVVRLPVAPAVEYTPGAEDNLTFYDTLAPKTGGRAVEGAQRDAAGPRVPASAGPTPGRELAAGPGGRAFEPVPHEPADAAVSGRVERPAGSKPERTPPSAARVTMALAASSAPTPQARGEWSVQVTATRDGRTAESMAQRLKAKGYEAYVVKVPRQGETLYRVRVGHYPSLDIANQAVSRLRREPGVPQAFVASD